MQKSALMAAICVGLPIQSALGEDALPLTNVTIDMIKHGGRGSFRIDAKIDNPNDFAVFDVRINCDIRDKPMACTLRCGAAPIGLVRSYRYGSCII